MKIKLNGSVATFISDLNFEDLKAATKSADLYITDDRGNRVYGVATGTVGNINKVGIVFTHANSEGKAACNIALGGSAQDVEQLKERLLDNFADAKKTYEYYEPHIIMAINSYKDARAAMTNDIEVG